MTFMCFMHSSSIIIQYVHLQVRGKNISWQHLMQLYHGGLGAKRNAGGLSLIPKLKYEHLYLTSFSKMRVDLAAQVKYSLFIFFYVGLDCYVYNPHCRY